MESLVEHEKSDTIDISMKQFYALQTCVEDPEMIAQALGRLSEKDTTKVVEILMKIHGLGIRQFSPEAQNAILSSERKTDRRLANLSLWAPVLDQDVVFERLAPHIEHFPDQSREILEKMMEKDLAATLKFVGDLAVVSYPFAEELYQYLHDRYLEIFQTDHEIFAQTWADVEMTLENRILLFPEVKD